MDGSILGQFAAIASIIEAIAVVISVIFIWYELRKNNQLTQAANTQALVELSSPLNLQLIQDAEVAALWVNGAKNFDQMDEVTQYRYKALLVWWLILHENIYYQWKNSLLSFGTYMPWKRDLEVFVKEQALEKFWGVWRKNYHPGFAAEIDQLLDYKLRYNSNARRIQQVEV